MNFQSSENPEYSGKNQLEIIEDSLPSYNRNIVKLITKNFPKNSANPPKVLDFGAGQGSLAILVKDASGISPECLELDPTLITQLRSLGLESINSLGGLTDNYDFVYTSNVLEHIKDDSSALKNIYRSMKPGGELLIYVPAFQRLFSDMDRQVGHVRRYGKSELRRKVLRAGFSNPHIRYVDSIGFPASIFMKFVGYNSKAGVGSAKSLIFYDRFIFPMSRFLDAIGLKFVFGKNLFLRARKED
jgi:SAM-dependent methyltransferase